MKRWEILLACAGAILLLLGAHWIREGELPRRDIVLQQGACHTPITVLDPPAGIAPAGSAIVLHGLSANRKVMFYLGQDFAGHGFRTYLLDLPGHGDNTDPFSFGRAEECARVTVETLTRTRQIDPAKTVLIGHSMGGAIAIRMADRIPVAATIAISPAPMVAPRRMPANLLVFSAQFDVWQLTRQAAALQQAAGGVRTSQDDFAQRRAFDLVHVALATHTSMLDDRTVAHRSELWAMQTLFPQTDQKTLALNLDLGTYGTFGKGRLRLAGSITGLIGIALLLPLCIALAARMAGRVAGPIADPIPNNVAAPAPPSARGYGVVLAETAIASLGGVILLMLGVPLRFLRMYAGDYLASIAIIVAIALLFFNRSAARAVLSANARQLIALGALAFTVFLAFGGWFNWEIADLWLNAPRWLRFWALLPFACIFCYAEEVVLGPLGFGRQRAVRFVIFLLLRLEIWLACLFAFFVLGSGQILLPILVVQFALFSIAQRLAADALLRRTDSVTATAFFGAILAAWFVAAVFPIT
jgi:pimeloyl-ACP methyl ester carboxylesterase